MRKPPHFKKKTLLNCYSPVETLALLSLRFTIPTSQDIHADSAGLSSAKSATLSVRCWITLGARLGVLKPRSQNLSV
jgi:hypothetical protein